MGYRKEPVFGWPELKQYTLEYPRHYVELTIIDEIDCPHENDEGVVKLGHLCFVACLKIWTIKDGILFQGDDALHGIEAGNTREVLAYVQESGYLDGMIKQAHEDLESELKAYDEMVLVRATKGL